MSRKYQITKNSNFWTSAGASPSSGARLGAGVSLRLLPPLALLMMLCGVFFSDSAYAASYINVSSGSGGTVSLGSIKPSATGVSAFGSDTLTITTNCSAGYSVYVSAQNGKDTSLTNSSASSNNTISASSTAVGSAATALSSNTWGINSENNNKYVGLPAYADATNTALITTSSANTSGNNTNTIYYGVKVDTTLTPGTYSGDILYTTLVNDSCNVYTLSFDTNSATSVDTNVIKEGTRTIGSTIDLSAISSAVGKTGYHLIGWKDKDSNHTYNTAEVADINPDKASAITLIAQWEANTYTITYDANVPDGVTVTGATENQADQIYGSTTTLKANGYVAYGYKFKGWAYDSSATEKDFDEEQIDVSVATLAANNASGSVVDVDGGTIKLYAVWELNIDMTTMQGWAEGNGCSALPLGGSITLRDTRDDQTYSVYRIPPNQTYGESSVIANVSGKCIMTQDLSLGYVTGGSIEKDSDLVLSDDDSAGATTSDAPILFVDSAGNGTGWSTDDTSTNLQYTNGPRSDYEDYSNHSYYSYGAALKVCPKGWRLPTSSEYGSGVSSDYKSSSNGVIYLAGNGAEGSESLRTSPWNFVFGGSFYSSGYSNQGSEGRYWSSSAARQSGAYTLAFDSSRMSSTILPSTSSGRPNVVVRRDTGYNMANGYSVRCIIDSDLTVYNLTYDGYKIANPSAPSNQTAASIGSSYTFTLPSTVPESYIPLVFKNYSDSNGNTYAPGDSVTLSSDSPSKQLTLNWDLSCVISTSNGCELADGRTWIFGYDGNTIAWNDIFTDATGVNGHDASAKNSYDGVAICPPGYEVPKKTDYDVLIQAYGGTASGGSDYLIDSGAISKIVGSSYDYWSSTEAGDTDAYYLYNTLSYAYSYSYRAKSANYRVLCYK